MKRFAATLIALLLFVSTSVPAFGWGDKGHKTIGQIAQLRLANTNALTKIKEILGPNETLSSIATWADKVKTESKFKPTATHPDKDTEKFFRNMKNQHNRNWHYVDLPLHCASYKDDACKSFTSSSDIVHMIQLSIKSLRGVNVPQLTARNALRLLVHLVGDLHQPLHVGVGFVNADGEQILIERNPKRVVENDFPSDIGGNNLLITGHDSSNLHSFWDSDLVEDASTGQAVSAFAMLLNNQIPASPGWDGQGNLNRWPEQWATDTLHVSNDRAYDDTVKLLQVVIIDHREKYRTTFGPNYASKNQDVVKEQLEKGGYRLAKLLEAIFP